MYQLQLYGRTNMYIVFNSLKHFMGKQNVIIFESLYISEFLTSSGHITVYWERLFIICK